MRLYTWRRVGLIDKVGCDIIPDMAGDEEGHGAVKPHGVSYGYGFNRCK